MKVKICGVTDCEIAIFAAEAGADAIGLVFAESKRRVTSERAKEIAQVLSDDVMKVGVFVNETAEAIEEIAAIVGLTHIQLHGEETAAFSKALSLPVIKAWNISERRQLQAALAFPSESILLDGPKGRYKGGNGLAFDWSVLGGEDFSQRKIILAGGLDSANIEEAVKAIRPYMVDVSSGVETNGRKDVQKIKAFIDKVKAIKQGERVR
jgi:phosphoribosylanthranilate isomerase